MNKHQNMIINDFIHENINNIEALITMLIEKQISESDILPAGFNTKELSLLLSSNFKSKNKNNFIIIC